jgi:GNAT superfamily N-acetyltransferase
VLSSDLPGALELAKRRGPAIARASRGITWQLELLGTLPEHRRKGLARSLLERQLQRCDQDGAAAWLETTDPVNPPIYERFGFETIAHIDGPRWLPGYWVMRREPQP